MIDPAKFLRKHPPTLRAGLSESPKHANMPFQKGDTTLPPSRRRGSRAGGFVQGLSEEERKRVRARARRRRARLRKKRTIHGTSGWLTFGARAVENAKAGEDDPHGDHHFPHLQGNTASLSREDNGTEGESDPKVEEEDCFDTAVSSLGAADATERTLRRRLASKGFDEETINRTMPRLKDVGLIDDERFAEDLLERCLRRLMGPTGVRREFWRKGLDRALADRLVEKAEEKGLFKKCAEKLVENVAGQESTSDRQVFLRKLASRAAARGLPMGLVRRAAANLLGE